MSIHLSRQVVEMIIAVDFDGTIAQYDGWKGEDHFGEPIHGAVAGLNELKHLGHTIIIHTCRPPSKGMVDYLKKHGIPFDRINVSPVDTRPRDLPHKLPADLYLDDKGMQFRGDWAKTVKLIKKYDNKKHEWSGDKITNDEELDAKVAEAEAQMEQEAAAAQAEAEARARAEEEDREARARDDAEAYERGDYQ